MAFIIIITIIVYAVLFAWTWKNLGGIQKNKKLAVIIIGMLVLYLITLLIFNIAKKGIEYQEIAIEKSIRNILVMIFTGINSLIVLPFMAKQFNKIHEGEIETKEFSKKIMILLIVFIICMCFESSYMKSTQQGILKVYEANGQMGKSTL